MPKVTEGYVNADDARLYFRSVGSGPAVVVIHGGPGMDHRLLLPQFDSLLPGFQVVLYDQRFCGRSTGCDDLSRLTIPQMVEDLEALRIGLGLSVIRTVGFSFGGLIAMQHAALHRQEVSHLVLLNSLPARAIDLAQFEAILAQRRSAENAKVIADLSTSTGFVAGAADSLSEYFRRWFRPYFFDENKLEQLTLAFSNISGRNFHAVFNAVMKSLGEWDFLEPISRLSAATLVVTGEHDPITASALAATINAIPNCRVVIAPQAGHFVFVEQPEWLNVALCDFLRGTAG